MFDWDLNAPPIMLTEEIKNYLNKFAEIQKCKMNEYKNFQDVTQLLA